MGDIIDSLIIKADNDILFDQNGSKYIDLCSAYGTTFLGHSNRAIVNSIGEQLTKIWNAGGLPTAIQQAAQSSVESFFPSSHHLGGFYSTGMEAGEFAIRLARAITQRNGIVGFAGSMYGKSIATAYLGWDNQNPVSLTGWHRLPFVADCAEDLILSRLQETLISKTIAAVFMEPIQGSNGCHCASRRFYQEVFHLCQEQGTLLVFDEILTGFYRTGSAFCFSEFGFVPDVVLIGKAIANGFPISGVVVNNNYPIEARMLPGSTFAGNPLAAAAVLATLKQIQVLQISDKVMTIAQVIKDYFKPLKNIEVILRGKGALWILELPQNIAGQAIALRLAKRGVIVSYANHWLRLLPAATIELDNLKNACGIIREEIYEAYRNASQ